jgi:hypothetical protein
VKSDDELNKTILRSDTSDADRNTRTTITVKDSLNPEVTGAKGKAHKTLRSNYSDKTKAKLTCYEYFSDSFVAISAIAADVAHSVSHIVRVS